MNLKTLETHINPVILQRGQDYYAAGMIQELEETETDFWQAWVQGSEVYDVEITLSGDTVTDYQCTCPYDHGPVCKHVAATLLGIRAQKVQQPVKKTTRKKKLTKAEQLEKVLNELPREELEAYIRETLAQDRKAYNHFLLRYQHLTGAQEAAAKRYRQQFDTIIRSHSNRGFIDYRSARGFGRDTDQLLSQLQQSGISPVEKIETCFALIESLIKHVINAIDDSDGGTGDIMHQLSGIMGNHYPELSAGEQRLCFEKLLHLEYESELDNYGLAEYLSGLTRDWSKDKPAFQDLHLSLLAHAIRCSTRDWQREHLLRRQLELLKNWGRHDKLEPLLAQHLDIPEFRRQVVEQALAEGNLDQAKQLIQQGIAIAEQKRHPGTVRQWRDQLLDIARQENDLPAMRAELQLAGTVVF
ncbi:MAG: hypothetical protein R3E95_11285 [Thiolinea sp.]